MKHKFYFSTDRVRGGHGAAERNRTIENYWRKVASSVTFSEEIQVVFWKDTSVRV